MKIITVRDLDLRDKRCLVRVDFNVPLKDGVITDDTRIKAALKTLNYILDQEGSSLVVMSHLGRPKGEVKKEFSLSQVRGHLVELLGRDVIMASDCIGEKNTAGEIGTEKNGPGFAGPRNNGQASFKTGTG